MRRRHSIVTPKEIAERRGCLEPNLQPDVGNAHFRAAKQASRKFETLARQVFMRGLSESLRKAPVEMERREARCHSNILEANRILYGREHEITAA